MSGTILEIEYLPTTFAYEIKHGDDEHRKYS